MGYVAMTTPGRYGELTPGDVSVGTIRNLNNDGKIDHLYQNNPHLVGHFSSSMGQKNWYYSDLFSIVSVNLGTERANINSHKFQG